MEGYIQGIHITDKDVVDADCFTPGDNGQYAEKPWILHDHGVCICIVFARHLCDALDAAADAGKLNGYLIEEASNTPGTKGLPASDYPTLGTENEDGITRLGNASEPYDIENVNFIELENPPMSFVALLLAAGKATPTR